MKTVLLTSKLTPPAATRYSVDRDAICERVFAGFGTKVVLVRAPAGFGKTTVMAQLVERYRQEGSAVGWITLDESDNDLPRFLSYLTRALRDSLQAGDTHATSEKSADSPAVMEMQINGLLHQNDAPIVLFLDEMEVIRDAAVLAFIRQLITRLPANARLIIGSRNAPEVGLAKLRAHAQLIEVAPEQLRFSAREADVFLMQRRRLDLRPEHVQSLLKSTEGWPTALWLASVALERRSHGERFNAEQFIAGFAGSDATVSDYLAEDVLAGQPDDIHDFLLKTSILSQLDAALCDAVCNRHDSAEMLERLVRDNLFLSRVDEQQRTYRYHALFRDFLRSQLTRHAPEQYSSLHRAAANWYYRQQRPIPAIDHAIEAGDLDFALPLLSQQAEALLSQGRLRLLTRWLEKLPSSELDQQLTLRLIHIWTVNLTRGPQEALAMLEAIDANALKSPSGLAQFNAMRPTLLGMRDQISESYTLGLERIQYIDPKFGFAYAMLSQTLANDSMILGHFADARRYADQAQTAQTGQLSVLQMGLAGAVNGAIDLMQGRLRQAIAELRLAAGLTDDAQIRHGSRHVMPSVLLAEVLYEAGRFEQAEDLLNVCLPLAQSLGLPDQLIIAHTTASRIAEHQGSDDRALDILALLESIGHRLGLPRVVASSRIEKANTLLNRGDIAGAREQLAQAADATYWQEIENRFYIANDKVNLSITQLRLRLRSGDAAQLISPIKQLIADAENAQRFRRALKLQILLAEALYADKQPKPAMRTLSRALDFAAGEGIVASFLEEGQQLREMLQELLRSRQNDSTHSEGDTLSQHLAEMVTKSQKVVAPPAANIASDALAEALTRKELQILELVGLGMTNEAMAKKLFVSESTVRTHLRSINTKLHASNRMHAVALARQLQLIP